LFAALLVIARALFIDAQAGINEQEKFARAAFFVSTACVIAYWANALRRYRRQSTEAITELAGREAVLRSILDTGPDAMLMIDSRGIVSSYGAAAEQLFGWTAEEVIGRNVGMLTCRAVIARSSARAAK
jgi:PAS domain-containing protein